MMPEQLSSTATTFQKQFLITAIINTVQQSFLTNYTAGTIPITSVILQEQFTKTTTAETVFNNSNFAAGKFQ